MRYLFGAALAVCLLVWAPPVAGQAVPDCAPEKTLNVTLTSKEKGLAAPLVATHDVEVEASFTGSTVRESLTPPPGVRVLGRGQGGVIEFIVPVAASVPMTVSWHQARDPSDPASDPTDPSTRCAASRVVTLAVEPARRSRAVKQPGWRQGFSLFAVVPALKRPDLSPLEISARTTRRVRFPSAKAKLRTLVVPMRTVDQIKYRKRLPDPSSLAKKCRFYSLTCRSVFTEVSRLFVDTDALRRGIVKGDLNGAVSLLARTQPSLEAARYGVSVEVRPGSVRLGKNRPFGYDVRVRQSGRLIARVRAAGRCVERRGSQGLFVQCRIRRRSTQLR